MHQYKFNQIKIKIFLEEDYNILTYMRLFNLDKTKLFSVHRHSSCSVI